MSLQALGGTITLPPRYGNLFRVLQLAVLFIMAHTWELLETLAGQVTTEVAGTAQVVEGESPEWGVHAPWWVGIDCLLGCRYIC